MKKAIALLIIIIFCTVIMNYALKYKERVNLYGGKSRTENLKESFITESSNKFAIDFYQKLSAETAWDSNFFFSPFSIYTAFGLLYEGAQGETSLELENVFAFAADSSARHEAFLQNMKAYGKFKSSGISIANSLWVNDSFPVKNSYKNIVSKYYYAEVQSLNFSRKASAEKINGWISNKTAGKIKNVISGDSLKESEMVLVNTVYFKEKWEIEFNKDNTRKEDFFITAENKIKADLMANRADYLYFENEDLKAVKLKYKDNNCNASMIVVLPNANNISIAENFIYSNNIKDISFDLTEGTVYLPKFEIEWGEDIKNLIKSMGISSNNYSGITSKEIDISKVIHKAFIKVDEKETEAVAVTAIEMQLTSAGPSMKKSFLFRADHPFVYMIVDENDGKILFMGKMANPLK